MKKSYIKPQSRAKLLENLLNLYDFLQEWRNLTLFDITSSFKIRTNILSLLMHENIIVSKRNSINGNKHLYSWKGIRPSLHMINAIFEKEKAMMSKYKDIAPLQTTISPLDKADQQDKINQNQIDHDIISMENSITKLINSKKEHQFIMDAILTKAKVDINRLASQILKSTNTDPHTRKNIIEEIHMIQTILNKLPPNIKKYVNT